MQKNIDLVAAQSQWENSNTHIIYPSNQMKKHVARVSDNKEI